MAKQSKVLYSDLILGSVTQLELADGFPALEIDHVTCQAKVSFYGGQVLAWQPMGEKEVFWLSDDALYQQGKAIRGGIPLCWPWFGPLEGTVQHGFVRQALWKFERLEVSDEGVSVILTFEANNHDEKWPYLAKVEQCLFFGKTFEQTLTIHNQSENVFEYNGALHSYFNVSSPINVTTPLLNESTFIDKLTGKRVNSLARTNSVGPIDTVYSNNKPQQLVDKEWQRIIHITNQHTDNWVLWNPGVDTAKLMSDVHDGGEQQFVCLEAASVNNKTVLPNQVVTMKQTIEVTTIAG